MDACSALTVALRVTRFNSAINNIGPHLWRGLTSLSAGAAHMQQMLLTSAWNLVVLRPHVMAERASMMGDGGVTLHHYNMPG